MCLKEEDLGSQVWSSDSETLPDIAHASVIGTVCPAFSDDVSFPGLTAFLAGGRKAFANDSDGHAFQAYSLMNGQV